ncbi:DUF4321 domain-containing protein [Clostridium boliviensis]|uniref:DUF4321 domain-containing protein n=1 Tax=Clostridium boliviensis TaxID=318465 RepID=A0ABU4GPJ2_9CLOT|nr:DUF4321 domain-containing protein [Clostridium boliviensis]MDW2799544.1 DUF4321 domain-containing protein [Clostridium boliviensis]
MRGKNYWVLLLLMLCGVVIGGFVGDLTKTISWLSWLNTGQSFGFDTPVIVNLGILVITFGIHIKITMAGIIGMAAALITYRLI